MSFTIELTESAQSQHPDSAATVGVTNGSARVGFGVSDQFAAISAGRATRSFFFGLTPEEATRLAVALLNAAENVDQGAWGGSTEEIDRACAYLEEHR